jgi:hypothetical protein
LNREESVRIYLRLDGDIAQQFIIIKKQLGLKNDSEVLRYLIAAFHKIKEEERRLDGFLEKLYDKVDRLEQDLKALEEQLRKSEVEKHEV